MADTIKKVESGAWHWIARALSVAVVFGVICGAFWIGYEKGKTKGYALASTDRATQTYAAHEQTVENNFNYDQSPAFALLSWGRLHPLSLDRKVSTPKMTQKVEEKTLPAKK